MLVAVSDRDREVDLPSDFDEALPANLWVLGFLPLVNLLLILGDAGVDCAPDGSGFTVV